MILQALNEYYQRKAIDKDSNVAPEGWEWKEIPYKFVIDRKGCFKAIEPTEQWIAKRRRFHPFLVPQSVKRTVDINAYLLWDNIEYALGANPRNRSDVASRHESFKKRIVDEIGETTIPSLNALQLFLDSKPLKQIESSKGYKDTWKNVLEENAFIIFSIEGEIERTVCDDYREHIWQSRKSFKNTGKGLCLITGEQNIEVARLHPPIKGVRGTNTNGGALISFNLSAFNSYKKGQNFNAPISNSAAFNYTTALNLLLSKDSQNKVYAGDSTIVFWAEKFKNAERSYDLESTFPWFIADQKDDPDRGVKAVKSLYESIHTGRLSASNERFYVLALAPNAARISVRFFHQDTVRDFGDKIKMHFDDFEIIRSPKDPEYLSVYRILTSTALEYKMDNVPPNLASAVIESILVGIPYPITLLYQCIRRIRADAAKKDRTGKSIKNVNRTRAAILKAYINRFNRFHKPLEKEVTVSLDKTNTNPGYLLGRLFAVLERAQNAANDYKEPNAGIRDRFYGAFSSSPITVYPLLEKLYGHHLGKIEKSKGYFEGLKGEIIDKLDSKHIPAHLTMEEQARFAIGYYHQRQDFFAGKKKINESEQQTETTQEGETK